MPKASYHCGNSVSQIISDIIFKYNKIFNTGDFLYVRDAWNLHGKPSEDLFLEENPQKDLTYENVLTFSESLIEKAEDQKGLFLSRNDNDIIYKDTDTDFIKFSQEIITTLIENKFIKLKKNALWLDIKYFFSIISPEEFQKKIDSIKIFPEEHRKSLISLQNSLNDLYPLTKNRTFAPKFELNNLSFSVNPILQSLIFPLFISKKFNCTYPCHTQVSSFGHSMIKWHYLRNIVSIALTNKPFCKNLVLHGSILGPDGKPMSKHSNNAIQPHDLLKIKNNKNFIRYTLIKSISTNTIPLQLNISLNEFNKIEKKLFELNSKKIYILTDINVTRHLNNSIKLLGKNKIKAAFEEFFLALRKSKYTLNAKDENRDMQDTEKLYQLSYIFLE